MALDANALITLAQAKEHLDIPTLDTDYDDRIERMINAVSTFIENFTNRELITATYTHRFNGDGGGRLIPLVFPVTAVTSIHDDDEWTFGATTEITDFDIFDETFIVLKKCLVFKEGRRNVKMVYTGGYVGPGGSTTIPKDLQEATLLLVELLYNARDDRRIGVKSKSKLGETVTFDDDLPVEVKVLLDPHTRENYIKRMSKGVV